MVLSVNDPGYQQCSLSVMDNIADPDIVFDEQGICNYYRAYKAEEAKAVKKGEEGAALVASWVAKMKEKGKGKQYDCMLGVSGGVDSTYLAYLAKQHGLRVLCVHFDNGWDSELAVKNVENIVNNLGFELYTYVINWDEFKDIQVAYFKAGVIDIEAVTDIAIFACLDKICSQFKLKYILDGRNVVTEFVLPSAWICKDPENLINIHNKFGTMPLKSYPLMSRWRRMVTAYSKPFQNVTLLDWSPYNKDEAKKTIINELGWKDYGGKHYESVFTRFYQGYILPEKFKVDKRKAHLSTLIFSGQITKEQALEELGKPIYPEEFFITDKEFTLKKLGFTEQWFDEYIHTPGVPHKVYGMSKPFHEYYPLLKVARLVYKTIFRKK